MIVMMLMLVLLAGCQLMETNPDRIEQGLAAGQKIGEAALSLGFLWPPAAGIGGLILGIIGAAKKLKPKLEQAETTGEAIHQIVDTIEKFKEKYPEGWKNLKEELTDKTDRATKALINSIKS